MHWPTERLGNIVSHKKGFAFKSEWFQLSGVPVVKVTNFTDNSVDLADIDCVSESIAAETYGYALTSNDIVIQTVGSWPNNPQSVVGKVIRVPKSLNGALLNQNAVILRPESKIRKDYLFYLLKDRSFKGFIINTAQGAANQASITLDSLFRFEFFLPPSEIQEKIAAILSAYDDLIENNQRRIALLENMAEEIYREWFVRLRFPGHEKVKKVKGVPISWQVRPLSGFASEIKRSIKKKNLADEEKYLGLEHIPRRSIAVKEWATSDTVDSDKLLFQERDILFGKIRPYLHKVALAHFSGACSSDTIVLRPMEKLYEGYLLLTVFSDTFVELATVASKGTKMPRADWEFLKKLELAVPDEKLLALFQAQFEVLFSQIVNLLRANEVLTYSRDQLLPRLISGKLSVENLAIQFPPSMEEAAHEI